MDNSFVSVGAADWRRQLALNQRKTKIVIFTFICMYLFLGFLFDIAWQVSALHYDSYGNIYHITLEQAIKGLATLKYFPILTLITGCIAVIALLIAFAWHDKIILMGTDYHEVKQDSQVLQEAQLYHVVEEMCIAAGLHYTPKVYIIDAPYMNAFASGYSEKSALVAITQGLLGKLDRSELQAVIAHELSHIRHLDIKLTLTVSILANLMLIGIDVLFWTVIYGGGRNQRENNRLFIIIYLIRIILPFVTLLLMLYLSRTRETMADAGSVELTRSNEPLARALLKIDKDYKTNVEEYRPLYASVPHEGVRRAAYLFDPVEAGLSSPGFSDLFSTHPSLKARLAAIGIKIR